jgi:RNA polymerase sigma factor (sigma-70 family)
MTSAGTLRAPRTAHPIEQFARIHHRTLERWLTGKFGRQLNEEDISDVLSETYRAALETEETLAFDGERMSAWAYQVARFRAIGLLRARHGRSRRTAGGEPPAGAPRRVVVSLDEINATDSDVDALGADVDDATGAVGLAGLAGESAYAQLADLLSDDARAEEARRVADALRRLPDEQREALQYVHIDGLTARAAAELLGTSKSSFHRVYQRAISRLRSLCAAEQGAGCARTRALLSAKAAVSPELLGWRDAHIEGCFSCQVAAGRRVQLLLPLLPVITVRRGGFSRLLDRLGSLLSRGGALPTEAVAAGVTTTAGGGAVGGASLLSTLGAKAAACALAAAVCAGAAVTVPVATHHHKRPRKAPAHTTRATRPIAFPTPSAQAARSVTTASTAAHETLATRDSRRAGAQRAAARARAALRAKRQHAAKTAAPRASAREFSPEFFGAAPSGGSAAAATAPASASASSTRSASTSPTTFSSRSSSRFAEEFRP